MGSCCGEVLLLGDSKRDGESLTKGEEVSLEGMLWGKWGDCGDVLSRERLNTHTRGGVVLMVFPAKQDLEVLHF